MPDKQFIKAISSDDGDRLRISITTRKGKVVNVMVQYEAIRTYAVKKLTA